MSDLVLDTNVLAGFLAQYFDPGAADRGQGRFRTGEHITRGVARVLNRILDERRFDVLDQGSPGTPSTDLVIASSAAFVEIAKKWESIVHDRFTVHQFHGFVQQPPEWFDIAPVDEDLIPAFLLVPCEVQLPGSREPVDWADALHAATALSRGDKAVLATTDVRIRHMAQLLSRVI